MLALLTLASCTLYFGSTGIGQSLDVFHPITSSNIRSTHSFFLSTRSLTLSWLSHVLLQPLFQKYENDPQCVEIEPQNRSGDNIVP